MYKKMVNYFENECCIDNIFMKKYWYVWYLVILVVFISIVICSILKLSSTISTCIAVALFTLFILFYFEIFKKEIKQELKCQKIKINWLAMFNKQRFIPAYYEFQEKKLYEYCKSNKIDNTEKEKFLEYVKEDLEEKYPNSKMRDNFLTIIIPTTISVVSIYLTNTETKDIENIIKTVIASIIYAGLIAISIYAVSHLGHMLVDSRRNMLELKEVLRNISI